MVVERIPAEDGAADAVVSLPADARAVVEADAGVGKTHLLCERIAHLVEQEGVSPGRGILVLSFTRAAVGEIRRRLVLRSRAIAAVTPVTFDSLATRILATEDSVGDWTQLDFDGRIRRAGELLAELPEIAVLDGIQHVFIDEAQDLVEARATFAVALLSHLDGGYTIFGDPAQAIYGFSDRDGAGSFLSKIDELPAPAPSHITLEGNRRARTEAAKVALWAGPLLRIRPVDCDVYRRLYDTVKRLPDVGGVADAAPLLSTVGAPTVILCRTNGEVLWVSEELRRLGVEHDVQRAAEDAPLAAWIARAFLGWQRNVISRAEVMRRIGGVDDDLDAEHAWAALSDLASRGPEMLDLDRLRERLGVGRIPDDLIEPPKSELRVSTVHRAKGLEFDRVLILEPRPPREDERGKVDEEAHVLYVALTRAVSDVLLLRRDGVPLVKKLAGRWTVRPRHPDRVASFEVGSGAVSGVEPAGGQHAATVQGQIARSRGREVSLRLVGADACPRYEVTSDGSLLGETDERFGKYVCDVLGRKGQRAPKVLDGAHVQLVETRTGHPAAGEQLGLGAAGMWLAPRLGGLVELDAGGWR